MAISAVKSCERTPLGLRPGGWSNFAAPSRFYRLAAAMNPWLWGVAIVRAVASLYVGFFVAPTDATQGDSYRIIFIHVPAAWISMVIYLAMAFWAAVGSSPYSKRYATSRKVACPASCSIG